MQPCRLRSTEFFQESLQHCRTIAIWARLETSCLHHGHNGNQWMANTLILPSVKQQATD